jgi:hypothetical protein
MVACAESLLRVEDYFYIAGPQVNRLPTGSNDDPTPDTKGLHRFSPLPIPILVRKGLDQNIGLWLSPFLHLSKDLPESNISIL